MSTEKLYEAITLIDDALIDEAATYKPQKVVHWKRWVGLAACLVLMAGVGSAAFLGVFDGMGASSNDSANAPNSSGGEGYDGSSTFMSYAGPVFPLTVLENADGMEAERDITLDFSLWDESIRSTDLLVTDNYSLTNTTDEDKTLTVLYPFVSNLMDLDEQLPTLTVDDTKMAPKLLYGLYTGGFQGVLGVGDPDSSSNLDTLTSWEGYKALLSDGSYLEQALGDYPDFTDTRVTVYEFNDPWGPEETKDIPNPSIRVTFDMDYSNTTVLSYGFHSGSIAPDSGTMGLGFSIPRPNQSNYGRPYYIILLGDDVENMEIEGYITGGWDTEQELEDFGVDVQRYETDLDTVLRKAVRYIYDNSSWQYGDTVTVEFDTYYGLFCDYLVTYGVLSEPRKDRYDTGWLEDLSDVSLVDRVCYLQTEITVPAGGSAKITAAMTKPASFDYYCARTDNHGVKGYDLVTRLGSVLTFTDQRATLLDHGLIEIIRQNFGFDPANNLSTVELDPAVEHYYLEVKRAS